MAAKSSGRVARSVPLDALPTGVRTALTIIASPIAAPRLFRFSFSYWMTGMRKKQAAPYDAHNRIAAQMRSKILR
jgi:hypothetical protein